MLVDSKFFVIGKGKVPNWFKYACDIGRAKVNYDDEGDIENVVVYSPTKTYVGKIGDTVLFSKAGLAIVPKIGEKDTDVEEIKEPDSSED